MAKQKKKKAKTKIVYRVPTELQLRIELEKKRLRVLKLIPYIEETGESTQDEGGETYKFTEASQVRKLYFEAFQTVGLTVSPVAAPDMMPQVSINQGLCAVAGAYQITDTKTGFSVIGWGVGTGRNSFWAANTAQTLAMKQFLLASFMANWRETQDEQFHVGEKTIHDMTPDEVIQAMRDFYGGDPTPTDPTPAEKKTKKSVKKTKKARKKQCKS
ncbi:hypothetical protein LCGC14_0358950 [marine sediment metagenome]|uniref:Uncharacterized protein n=1 Tax=marine sediment metagenome TaxID=412755 RepID=A0A0F9T8S5_9ZZZZ